MHVNRTVPLFLICLLCSPLVGAGGESASTDAVRAPSVKVVHVIVALCDQKRPGMEHVPPSLGNATDPARNLYWGAQFGVQTWFRSQAAWTEVRSPEGEIVTPHPAILKRVVFFHKDTSTYLVADAYEGTRAGEAIRDILFPRPGDKVEGVVARPIYLGTRANLRAYVGYNALKDNPLQTIPTPHQGTVRPAIFLASESEASFAPYLEKAELWPLLATRTPIEPEAYVLDAAIRAWAGGETPEIVRTRAAEAYAQYQELEPDAAVAKFVAGEPPDPPSVTQTENGHVEDEGPAVEEQDAEGGDQPTSAPDAADEEPPVGVDARRDVPAREYTSPRKAGGGTTLQTQEDVGSKVAGDGLPDTPPPATSRRDTGETGTPAIHGREPDERSVIGSLPLPPAYTETPPGGEWTEAERAWRAYLLALPLDVPSPPDEPEAMDAGRTGEAGEAIFGVVRWPPPHRLQQSAGVAIRAYATFLRQRGRPVSFRSMSGDEMAYDKWLTGEYRISEDGTRILYTPQPTEKQPRADTDAEFDRYLLFVMTYTNVTSLLRDVPRVPDGEALRWGDLYMQPPENSQRGQVSMILRMATGTEDESSRLYLFGGGGYPARPFYVYRARAGEGDRDWFSLDGFIHRMKAFGAGTFHRFPLEVPRD